MRIDSSGKVGIGISSPTAILSCYATGGSTVAGLFRTDQTDAYISFRASGTASDFSCRMGVIGENLVFLNNGANERMRLDSSGNLLFNSGYGSVATAYGCRAWVNFNGTGTITIRASGNVSSITDNGTGDYTVNFTTAMPDANYACLGFGEAGGGAGNKGPYQATSSSSGARVFVYNSGGSLVDSALMNIAIFR
jgi:hypothetical protein